MVRQIKEMLWRDWTRCSSDCLLTPLLELMFPSHCAFCGCSEGIHAASLKSGIRFCQHCLSDFTDCRNPCPVCAAPGPTVRTAGCPWCKKRRYRFSSTIAGGLYQGKLQAAILQLKSGHNEALGEALGAWLADGLEKYWTIKADAAPRASLVVPVGCHWRRRWTRGSNPAECLSRPISRILSIPLQDRLLRVRRKSSKQGTLSPNQRFENVRGLFRVPAGYSLASQRVLLVDDVMTTGATASDAARALLEAGASRVDVLVAARGVGRQ